jgi:hypothetical protein
MALLVHQSLVSYVACEYNGQVALTPLGITPLPTRLRSHLHDPENESGPCSDAAIGIS